MDDDRLMAVLSALGQRTRLDVFRCIRAAGVDGVQTGAVAEAVGMPVNYIARHLQILTEAGLISKHVRGRTATYVADEETAQAVGPALAVVLASGRATY